MTTLGMLLDDLNSDDTTVYRTAKERLRKIGRMVIPSLVDRMLSRSERPAWRAAMLLAEMQDPNCTFAFLQGIKCTNSMVRQIAAQYLSKNGDRESIGYLLNSLNDEDQALQIWVVEALGNLGDTSVVSPLLALLNKTDSFALQHSIIKLFGSIGDFRAA